MRRLYLFFTAMAFDHSLIQRRFDAAALTYDTQATLQYQVGEALIHLLHGSQRVPHRPVILDLGCGTGQMMPLLTTFFMPAHVYGGDLSQPMLAQALRHAHPLPQEEKHPRGEKVSCLTHASPVRVTPMAVIPGTVTPMTVTHEHSSPMTGIVMNFDAPWPPLPPLDLVYANMALQWSVDLVTLFTQCAQRLSPQGVFAFSLPLKGTLRELQACGGRINAFVTHTACKKALRQAGFHPVICHQLTRYEKHTSLLAGMRHLRALGAHGIMPFDALLGRTPSSRSRGEVGSSVSRALSLRKSLCAAPVTFTYHLGLYVVRQRP